MISGDKSGRGFDITVHELHEYDICSTEEGGGTTELASLNFNYDIDMYMLPLFPVHKEYPD